MKKILSIFGLILVIIAVAYSSFVFFLYRAFIDDQLLNTYTAEAEWILIYRKVLHSDSYNCTDKIDKLKVINEIHNSGVAQIMEQQYIARKKPLPDILNELKSLQGSIEGERNQVSTFDKGSASTSVHCVEGVDRQSE